ncbi:Uncharacterised protein [Legionella busanensis]|uniref:Uncharacterized protein n=1 Tax=Legionella busanensis TaxID=190655 RepID=A0A378JNH8_9GAMM|nr:hypothetical protein [Legionella busanensis]STX51759.1 Uncharacterised protein [Legionella busanensis]
MRKILIILILIPISAFSYPNKREIEAKSLKNLVIDAIKSCNKFSSNNINKRSNLSKLVEVSLEELNKQFLINHHKAAQASRKEIKQVIVNLSGKLSLWVKQDNQFVQKDSAIIPSPQGVYSRVKQISHIPLLILEYVKQLNEGLIEVSEFKKMMKDIDDRLPLILKELPSIFNDEIIEIQRKILIETQYFILIAINDYNVEQLSQKTTDYFNKINYFLDKNIDLGGEAIINELDHQINKWHLKNKIQLMHTRVVIVGPQGPRDGEPMIQYFEGLFNQYLSNSTANFLSSKRVYYFELLPKLMSKLNIKDDLIQDFLFGEEFNKLIANQVLFNSNALFKNILKDSAHKKIEQVFGFS